MTRPQPLPHAGSKSTHWVLVADGSRARVFLREPVNEIRERKDGPNETETWAFLPVTGLQFRSVSLAAYDTGKNALSSVFGGNPKIRHESEPHANLRRKVKQDLALRMAAALNQAKRAHRFDELTIVAPPMWLGWLRPHLNAEVREVINEEITRDLMHLTPPRLAARLRELLPARALP